MPKVQFIFALHNHQPVGNFDFVAEEAYQKSYLPFIQVLKRHPSIKVTLHYTGILYHFFERHHPDFLVTLARLVKSGRAEILSGGFYEPILAVLPDADKAGQIHALSDYIQRTFGYDARGMWLAERVWEPHLPKPIAEAGINHVVVDDFHFKMAGLRDADLDGYYLSEEQNHILRIFPGSEKLRYLIPFRPPEETISLLASLRSTERNRMAVMADDGEKFGVWPETYHSVYEEGWLDRFFTLLEQNSDWLETTTFSEYLMKEPPRGKVYLPTASYMEMGEWSLPTVSMKEYGEAIEKAKSSPEFAGLRPFIKGGIWRNFLAKYPESDHMHKRTMMVSEKVNAALALGEKRGKKQGPVQARMLDHLYQSQCNDSYWHGVFGGLYLPHLRSAVYEHLIEAEYMADTMRYQRGPGSRGQGKTKKPSWIVMEQGDFDQDGKDEYLLNSGLINLFIDPAEGGRLTELDWKPRSFNLTNALTRRREGYHDKISRATAGKESGEVKTIHDRVVVKEEGLESLLQYDRYKRGSLLDHFFQAGADLNGFMRSEHEESGDFILGAFTAKQKKHPGGIALHLERVGKVSGLAIRLRKEILLGKEEGGFTVRYEIENLGARELNTSFGCEFNFSLLAGNAHDRYYDIPGHTLEKRHLASTGETANIQQVNLVDEWLKLKLMLTFSRPAHLWRAPVETVSQSEAGFERVYQSSMVMPLWSLSLLPGRTWGADIKLRIE